MVGAGVITPDVSARINEYYQSKQKKGSAFPVVLAILGSLLVAFGLVLVLAHNWDELPKTAKTIVAFLPLVVGQGLCLFCILKKKTAAAWRESSSLILFFAIPIVMALISQIYHVQGDLPGFIISWLALGIALVYIMNSSVVSLISIALLTWYACIEGYSLLTYRVHQIPYLYFIGMALLAFHYYRLFRTRRYSAFMHLHNWFLSASIIIVFGAFMQESRVQWIVLGYVGLFNFIYLIGRTKAFNERYLFLPFRIPGIAGIIVMFITYSYPALWDFSFENDYNFRELVFSPASIPILLLFVAMPFVWRNMENEDRIDPVNYGAVFFLLIMVLFARTPWVAAFLMTLFLLATGIYFVRKGSHQNHLGILNFGLAVIAVLAISKFFDASFPFIWRGICFLAAGIGFFVANFMMIKKRKSLSK